MIAIFPKITAYANQLDYERLACLMRRYFGGTQVYSLRPDIMKMLENIGLPLSQIVLDSRGAVFAKDEKGRFQAGLMIGREATDQCEQRFLIAHLLGHFILHLTPAIARGELGTKGYGESQSPAVRYGQALWASKDVSKEEQREVEADLFAAALLVPVGLLKRAYTKVCDPRELSQMFGVTYAVMTKRLTEVGLAPDRASGFLTNEQQLKNQGPSAEPQTKKLTPTAATESCVNPSLSVDRIIASPQNITKINTILASNNYGGRNPHVAASASAAAPAATMPSPKEPAPPVKSPNGRGGMDRIRELARKIDSTVR